MTATIVGMEKRISCYHDVMTEKKTTTVRLPEELAETVEVVARGKGVSVNALVIDALTAEIERVRHDEDFMSRLEELTRRDKEILDRLAE
jgi:predicted DNA-binding protein